MWVKRDPLRDDDLDMEVLKIEKEYFAIIEINGEQTMMSIRATIKGNNDKISFLFDKGLNGFGYEHLKKKDLLFELRDVMGKLITHWHSFEPRLREEYINDIVCFKKL
jgi:hypothetical protein